LGHLPQGRFFYYAGRGKKDETGNIIAVFPCQGKSLFLGTYTCKEEISINDLHLLSDIVTEFIKV
jgi:hypothetical protein